MELSSTQAGAAIGLSDQAIRDHIAANRLNAKKIGIRGIIRIPIQELCRFAAEYQYEVNEGYLQNLEKSLVK